MAIEANAVWYAGSRAQALPIGLQVYLFAVVLLLPMDWFAPTGMLFREFGAKPATLVLTAGGLWGLLVVSGSRIRVGDWSYRALLAFAAWLALGFAAAFLNFVLDWSGWDHLRSPLTQLLTQAAMFVVCAIAVLGNMRLLSVYPAFGFIAKLLPWAALAHLTVFAVEAAGIIPDTSGPLLMFRSADQGIMERPSGLFSEPSYFGTFAALYGTALLWIPASHARRLVHAALAVLLYVSAVLVGAKTFVVVAAAQAMFLIFHGTASLSRRVLAMVLLALIAGTAVFFIQTYSALDVEQNLSSAMRLGSSLVAVNVVAEGYALPGIGFGQFHFFYRPEFAPNFLYLSAEGVGQLALDAENRASTFNLYLRVLLETGVLGLILLLFCLRALWFARLPPQLTYISLMFAGALGFLMTQDTYFYPPLVFTSAAILAGLTLYGRDRQQFEN